MFITLGWILANGRASLFLWKVVERRTHFQQNKVEIKYFTIKLFRKKKLKQNLKPLRDHLKLEVPKLIFIERGFILTKRTESFA